MRLRSLRCTKGFAALLVYVLTTFVFFCLTLYKDVYLKQNLGEAFPPRSSNEVKAAATQFALDRLQRSGQYQRSGHLKITWVNVPVHLRLRPDAMFSGFDGCPYSNCKMSYITADAKSSDAVIFTGRLIPANLPFVRPTGQIWIFYEHEPPYRYGELTDMWNQNSTFNWTMTYNKDIADIYLPYGELRRNLKPIHSNINEILKHKNKTALMIMSHCDTPAERLKYVEELKRYVDVDVLGKCGKDWDCGKRFLHDDCFKIINSYKFYLAFENSFCSNYFTEKIYDNFDYDTVIVSRGGKKGQIKKILPRGTFISAEDFANAKELGIYLNDMTSEQYINILKKKQLYTSMNSYPSVFHNAMCDLCNRMNKRNKFRKTIKDMNELIYSTSPCIPPSDLE